MLKSRRGGGSNSTAGGMIALHAADQSPSLTLLMVPQALAGVIPKHHRM